MNKIKGSIAAKAAAWIGITCSGILFAGSVVGAALMWDMGLYDASENYTRESLKKEAFESVSNQYSIMALDWMLHPENAKKDGFEGTHFRYGIIKADNLDNINLNDEKSYVERNFTQQVSADSVYTVSQEIGENTAFSYSDTLFGGYGVYNHAPTYLISAEVYETCYDKDTGLFYYVTAEDIYPVADVTISLGGSDYEFFYDFEHEKYRNIYYEEAASEGVASEGTVTDEAKDVTYEASDTANTAEDISTTYTAFANPSMENLLKQDYISFNELDNTESSYENWNEVRCDGLTQEIQYIDAGYLTGRTVTEETLYDLDENGFLQINHTDTSDVATYWVVSIVPENVGQGLDGDLFAQANAVANFAFTMRYGIYGVMVAAVGFGVFCFVFLICAAGHRKNTEEIVRTGIDKIPFDLYLIMAGVVAFVLIFFAAQASFGMDNPLTYIVLIFLALCVCWIILMTILTFAVRIKTKTFWSNTITGKVFGWFGRILRFIYRNLPILGKAIVIYGCICLVEFILVVMIANYVGEAVLLLFVEKMLVALGIFWAVIQMKNLQQGGQKIAEGNLSHKIDTSHMYWDFKEHGENLNSINEGMSHAVDERMKSERFKTELITNVSHDIKTPLTSIINYVDLLEKEELNNETVEEYLEVLERQSDRLKKLIEDLIEASKASTGNLSVQLERLEAGVFMVQTVGEFEEKTKDKELELIIKKPEEPVYIMADGRHFWRVIDNLMNNICKYAQPSTRVYIDMEKKGDEVSLTFRNTSKYALNITSEELMERFVRGDSSRNTEGSGLGLSIAKSLTELMGGTFNLYVDGDLFKVELVFSVCI